MAYAEEIGFSNNNPHTCYLGETKSDPRLVAQAALKLKADPKGLLNPGKLRTAKRNSSLAPAFPQFLYV